MDDLTKARALLDDQRMNSLFDQEVKEDTVYTSSSSSSSSSDGAIPLYDYGCHAIDELPESELLPLSRRLCVSRNKLEGRFVLWNPTGEGQKCGTYPMYVFTHVRMHVCMYVCMYVWMCVCILHYW